MMRVCHLFQSWVVSPVLCGNESIVFSCVLSVSDLCYEIMESSHVFILVTIEKEFYHL